jgi:hypothetical protein
MTPTFGRILLVEKSKALIVPLSVPPSWAKKKITLALCDLDNAPLAMTLAKQAAFTGPSMAIASYMARDVELHLMPISGSKIAIVASCELGTVVDHATVSVA